MDFYKPFKKYVKGHVSLEEVTFAKESFDIFDTDHSGAIDCKCKPFFK